MYSVYTIEPDINWIFCYRNIPHGNGRIQSMHFCVHIAIAYKLLESEEYIIILAITVIVSQSGSNTKLTGCYAYLTEIWCVGSQHFGQPVIWLDYIHLAI